MTQRFALATFLVVTFCGLSVQAISGTSTEKFGLPMLHGKRVDYCFLWGDQCGKPSADAFCKTKGYQYAFEFPLQPEIGASNPTYIQGVNQICPDAGCRGFKYIFCARETPGGGSYGNDNVGIPNN